jgi:hypothetical protein
MVILWGVFVLSVSEEAKQAVFVEAMEQIMGVHVQEQAVSAN